MSETPNAKPDTSSPECTGGIRMTRERVSADNKRIILNILNDLNGFVEDNGY